MTTLTEKNPALGVNHEATRRTSRTTGLLTSMLRQGFWFCNSCQRQTEIVQSDNGQPNKCGHADCGSVRVQLIASVAL